MDQKQIDKNIEIKKLQCFETKQAPEKIIKTKKKRLRHSSVYNQQIKQMMTNLKRVKSEAIQEKEWNTRFTLGQIPHMISTKQKQKQKKDDLSNSKLKKKVLQLGLIKGERKGYKTLNLNNETRGSHQFNIRVVSKLEKPKILIQSFEKKQVGSENQKNKEVRESNDKKQALIKKIQELSIQNSNLRSHHNLLIKIVSNSSYLSCRQSVQEQIKRLRNKTSSAQTIIKAIEQRQKTIGQFKQKVEKKLTEEQVMDYRYLTAVVFEEILAWKSKWQQFYFEKTNQSIALEFEYQNKNYFLTIASDTLFITNNKQDPFLLSQASNESFENQAKIKIRACELLLLEQQLNSFKQ